MLSYLTANTGPHFTGNKLLNARQKTNLKVVILLLGVIGLISYTRLFVAKEATKTGVLPGTVTDAKRIKHQARLTISIGLKIGRHMFPLIDAVAGGTSMTVTRQGSRLQRGGMVMPLQQLPQDKGLFTSKVEVATKASVWASQGPARYGNTLDADETGQHTRWLETFWALVRSDRAPSSERTGGDR